MTQTQTVKHVDLKGEDFTLEGFLSKCSLYDRSKDNKSNLIFVQFVGSKKMEVSPTMLYFGDLEYGDLELLKGSKCEVLLQASEKGFNVKHIQVAK